MKALRYENKKLSVSDVPKPQVDGEAVVRVTLSGICNTDLEIARGYAGFVGTADTEDVLFKSKQRIPAVYSIGKAETFGDDYPMLIEAHLLIENVGDLTGKWLAMDFIERIRDQKRFVSKESLIEQIGVDCKQAMQVLPGNSKLQKDGN